MAALTKLDTSNALVTRDVSTNALVPVSERFTTRVAYEKVIGAFLAVAKDVERLGVRAGPKARSHGFTAWSQRNAFAYGATSAMTGLGAFFTGLIAADAGTSAGTFLTYAAVAAAGSVAAGIKAATAEGSAKRQAARAIEHRATVAEAAGVLRRVRAMPPELRGALRAPIEALLEGEGRGVLSTDAQSKLHELLQVPADAVHTRAGALAGWINTVRVAGYADYAALTTIARQMPPDERELAKGCIVDALPGTQEYGGRRGVNGYEVGKALTVAL